MPHELLEHPKQGFEPPVAAWLRGPLRDWADDLLQTEALSDDGLLDAGPIAAAWREHRDGLRDRSDDLWNVLMYQAWRAEWH
jgi:asparagine synthase (glutamine-hydrolysing)